MPVNLRVAFKGDGGGVLDFVFLRRASSSNCVWQVVVLPDVESVQPADAVGGWQRSSSAKLVVGAVLRLRVLLWRYAAWRLVTN